MLQEIWNDAIIPALVTLLTATLSILVGYAISALRAWAAKQDAQWKRAIVDEATAAAAEAVAAVNQTFTADIKAARADGRLTAEEAATAFRRARDIALNRLGEAGLAALAKVAGSKAGAQMMVGDLIESAVAKTKTPGAALTLVR